MFHVPTVTQQVLNWLWPPVCVHCRQEGKWLCAKSAAALVNSAPGPIAVDGCDAAWVGGLYDQAVRAALIQKIKYAYWSQATEAVRPLLQPLVQQLGPVPADTIIVPVPLHPRRQRERGFNQSQRIAAELGQLLQRPVVSVVRRTRYTKSQAQLPAARRQQNVMSAFTLRALAPTPFCAILVDDVITTGATISACAHVLRHAGVKKIVAVALAKG